MGFKEFILRMLSAEDDISHKRVIGFASFLVLVIGAGVDMFTPFTMASHLADIFMYIVLAAFFASVAELYSKRSGRNPAGATVKIEGPVESITQMAPQPSPNGQTNARADSASSPHASGRRD